MKEATTRGSSRVPVYSYFLHNNAVLCTCCAQLFRAFPAVAKMPPGFVLKIRPLMLDLNLNHMLISIV